MSNFNLLPMPLAKMNFSLWRSLVPAALVLVAGCSSQPAKHDVSSTPAPPPPSQPQQSQAAALPSPAAAEPKLVATPVDTAGRFPAPASPSATEPKDNLPPGLAKPPAPFEGEGWQALFNGENLEGWRETQFAGHGEVQCRPGLILLKMGDPFTGVNYTNQFPTMNYEVALDAARVMGSDFFCGLTVPVGDSFCSLIVGGWGGSLVGISSLDGMDASENQTTKFINFESGRWYRIRLRVTQRRIEAWLDQEQLINVDTTDRRISLRPGDIELSKPLGVACWQTSAAVREIKVRRVTQPAAPAKSAM
jgi:hypothetical protein